MQLSIIEGFQFSSRREILLPREDANEIVQCKEHLLYPLVPREICHLKWDTQSRPLHHFDEPTTIPRFRFFFLCEEFLEVFVPVAYRDLRYAGSFL